MARHDHSHPEDELVQPPLGKLPTPLEEALRRTQQLNPIALEQQRAAGVNVPQGQELGGDQGGFLSTLLGILKDPRFSAAIGGFGAGFTGQGPQFIQNQRLRQKQELDREAAERKERRDIATDERADAAGVLAQDKEDRLTSGVRQEKLTKAVETATKAKVSPARAVTVLGNMLKSFNATEEETVQAMSELQAGIIGRSPVSVRSGKTPVEGPQRPGDVAHLDPLQIVDLRKKIIDRKKIEDDLLTPKFAKDELQRQQKIRATLQVQFNKTKDPTVKGQIAQELAEISDRISKISQTESGQMVFVDPNTRQVIVGPADQVGLISDQARLRSAADQLLNLDNTIAVIRQLEDSISQGNIGIAGDLRITLAGLISQGSVVGRAIATELAGIEMNLHRMVEPEDLEAIRSRLIDRDASAVQTLGELASFRLAMTFDPSGRLTEPDVKAARKALGVDRALATEEDVRNRMSILVEVLSAEGNRLRQSAGLEQTEFGGDQARPLDDNQVNSASLSRLQALADIEGKTLQQIIEEHLSQGGSIVGR